MSESDYYETANVYKMDGGNYYEYGGNKKKNSHHHSDGGHSLFTLFLINNWGVCIAFILIVIGIFAAIKMWGKLKDTLSNGLTSALGGLAGGLVSGVGNITGGLLGNIPGVGGVASDVVTGVGDGVGDLLSNF